jgi:hypothetical protein
VRKAKKVQNAETDIIFEQIRQAGICKRYEQLKDQDLSPKECLEKTTEFARISEKQAYGILTGKKQPPRKKTSSFSKYLEEIELSTIALKNSGNCKGRRNYEEIRRAIEKDAKLNDEEKRALASEIDNMSKKVARLRSCQKDTTEASKVKSLLEAIEQFGKEKNTSTQLKEEDAAIEIEKYYFSEETDLKDP